jgi:hypothetical protein
MLLAITYQLAAALEARGVSVPVIPGPERLASTPVSAPRIVVERDRELGDTLAPPTTHRRNPRLDHVRNIGAVLRVFARSTIDGARTMDHEREVDLLVDQCLVALRGIVSARRTMWELRSAKLLSADEAAARGLEAWPGVIYEVRFAVARGVTSLGLLDAQAAAAAAGTHASAEATFGGAHGVGTATTLDLSDSPLGGTDGALPSATTRN